MTRDLNTLKRNRQQAAGSSNRQQAVGSSNRQQAAGSRQHAAVVTERLFTTIINIVVLVGFRPREY